MNFTRFKEEKMDKSIRKERIQSLLKELLQEALASLNDIKLNSLSIIDVLCSRGKYDAEIFIYADEFSSEEQCEILKGLRRAESILRKYVLNASGWYKCPKFNFCFDETIKKAQGLDEIFSKIAKENIKNIGNE